MELPAQGRAVSLEGGEGTAGVLCAGSAASARPTGLGFGGTEPGRPAQEAAEAPSLCRAGGERHGPSSPAAPPPCPRQLA